MDKKNVSKKIIQLVSSYGKLIRKNGLAINQLILFGSYAKGLFRKSSDIDVAVISKGLEDEHAMQIKLSKLTWDFDVRIEPHPISFSDYVKNESPFIAEIRKTGIRVI